MVNQVPSDLEAYPHKRLRQGYLVVDEDAALRVRETEGSFKLTLKRGRGLERMEVDLPVSQVQADLLWPLAAHRLIDKTRYRIPDPGGELELDLYHGRHQGLILVEREFQSTDEARRFHPPSWMDREVTEDPNFTNARLATVGLPLENEPSGTPNRSPNRARQAEGMASGS